MPDRRKHEYSMAGNQWQNLINQQMTGHSLETAVSSIFTLLIFYIFVLFDVSSSAINFESRSCNSFFAHFQYFSARSDPQYFIPRWLLTWCFYPLYSSLAALMSADIARTLWSLVCGCLRSYCTFHLFPLPIFVFQTGCFLRWIQSVIILLHCPML